MNCPKCLRPINEGNSPNAEECHETDDDEGVCEAYVKIAALTEERDRGRAGRAGQVTLLRAAWEKGFRLCRAYGDNHFHFADEQKERQWKKALEELIP